MPHEQRPLPHPAKAPSRHHQMGLWQDEAYSNNADVILLIRYQAGWTGLTINEAAADFNEDGSVNMKDIILLIRSLV